MSSQRSSSGVRDLRAMFENQGRPTSQDKERGRSPTSATVTSANGTDIFPSNAPTRKVMASFVQVGGDQGASAGLNRTDSVGSIKEEESAAVDQLKNGTAGLTNPFISAVPGSSVGQEMTLPDAETRTDHMEKGPSAVLDEEAVTMQPGDTTSKAAASSAVEAQSRLNGKDAPAKVAPTANGSSSKSKIARTGRPSDVSKLTTGTAPKSTTQKPSPAVVAAKTGSSTIANTKPSTAQQSTAAARAHAVKSTPQKSPNTSTTTPPKRSPTQPVQLPANLTAPTASYAAKHEAAAPTTKAASKPIELSSHLMAPTAASAAKRPESSKLNTSTRAAPVQKRDRASLTPTTGGPAARAIPSGRASLAGTNDIRGQGSSKATEKRPGGDDFLSRMTKPTASSTVKSSDKADPKPATRAPTNTTAKPQVNGVPKTVPKPKPVVANVSKAAASAGNRAPPKTDLTKGVPSQPATPTAPVAITKEVEVIEEPKTPQDKLSFAQTTATASTEDDSLIMVGGALMGRALSTPSFAEGTIH